MRASQPAVLLSTSIKKQLLRHAQCNTREHYIQRHFEVLIRGQAWRTRHAEVCRQNEKRMMPMCLLLGIRRLSSAW